MSKNECSGKRNYIQNFNTEMCGETIVDKIHLWQSYLNTKETHNNDIVVESN